MLHLLNKVLICVLTFFLTNGLAAENLAECFIVGQKLFGSIRKRDLYNLYSVLLKALYGRFLDCVGSEYNGCIRILDLFNIGVCACSHARSRTQILLVYLIASAHDFAVIAHISDDIGGVRVKNNDIFRLLIDLDVGDFNRVLCSRASCKSRRRGYRNSGSEQK